MQPRDLNKCTRNRMTLSPETEEYIYQTQAAEERHDVTMKKEEFQNSRHISSTWFTTGNNYIYNEYIQGISMIRIVNL